MDQDREFIETLVSLNRVSKVVKGGRRFSFTALSVVGDGKGSVGYGYGKANDVTEAIRKSIQKAKQSMVTVPMQHGTLPHEIQVKFKSTRVLLKPAAPGTGVIAGGPVRAVLEAAGYSDVLTKVMGSRNSTNVVQAVFRGLQSLLVPGQVAKNRGKSLSEIWS
ncbi:30S ribosomal protein S5 [Spirochaeta thermophila]|uniref:Small ribosomal subunit protein uS5 n=1 Tax=Winmispira thermophila (strain ATCC 49972 / DSM 6192 / RI 19.B1) TaxID=665571 RepID=E0RQ98_WINT6|nr:30S ribosomal protein S5 [Spirochaeta thermophila]ADN01482.1 30S ribosomal protein S5 [Spirochaeta thermophila DSM 6192]